MSIFFIVDLKQYYAFSDVQNAALYRSGTFFPLETYIYQQK